MSAQPVKKKRYEGLIQFQDPLRQALVCLQAALDERFVTGSQLDFLKGKDDGHGSHFLLTADGTPVGDVENGLKPQHLLMRIEQLENQMPMGPVASECKILAWLSASDPLAVQYFFQILAQIADPLPTFDLKQGTAWGSSFENWQYSKALKSAQPWLCPQRSALLKSCELDTKPLFQSLERKIIITDGCSVTLLMEGTTQLTWNDLATRSLAELAKSDRHLVALNYTSGSQARLQCAFVTPMRLPLKDLESSVLKGFLLLRDIKETVKMPGLVIRR